ncbi:MAG: hypothetical protein LQ339_009032 [Xanthoria mediterranea]|nr:MAG: hypothetical protein LQ339_009032 [Xanthoria mediterranea]
MSSQCLGYLRRLAGLHCAKLRPGFHQQVRGKKKNAKGPHIVNVRLLEDIRGYGRKGSIIPIAPGRMRNIYYPQRKAEYVTKAQMQTTNQKDVMAERDFSFGLPQTHPDPQPTEEVAIGMPVKLLTPKRTSELIEAQVPSDIIFYRVPIVVPEPEPATPEPVGNSINAIGGEAPVRKALESEPSITRIFGSVSTADIVESIKAILLASEDGARVVLAPENVKIKEKEGQDLGIELDRLKALGEFEIEIRVKGVDPLQRRVVIRAQEADI